VTVTKGSQKKRIFYSIFVPPLVIAPVGVPLFLFGVDVSTIRGLWYLSIFISCVYITVRDKISISQIGLSKQKLGLSLLLTGVWEMVTFLFLGIIPFFALTGRLPTLAPLNETMITSALHFILVSIAEETWMRGLLLRRLREWRPVGSAPVVWSSIIFVLYHVPATSFVIIQDLSLVPLLVGGWFALFVWSAGLAVIVLKTGNLFGPIVAHGVDNFVSKVLCPLQI
jgi:membrane protease YdiL (CAAX protease family)